MRQAFLLDTETAISFAHITNPMGNVDNSFEKGMAQGSLDAVEVITQAAKAWLLGAVSKRE